MSKARKKNYSAIIVLFIAVLSVGLSILIFYQRFDFKFDAPIKSWVDTATYFNNLLSPLFLFITILLLYWTWKDTRIGFQQQSEDNAYKYIIDSTSQFAESFKSEISRSLDGEEPKIRYMNILGQSYTLFLTGNLKITNDELEDIYTAYRENISYVSVAATFFFKQYSQINGEKHKASFKLHLFGTLGKDVFNSMIFTKLGIKYKLQETNSCLEDTIAEIEFLKSVTLIAHNDANNKLIDSYFDDKKLDSFYMILNPK